MSGTHQVFAAALLELEELAFRAWPAEEVAVSDGWRLRFMRGVTRRANSVWPHIVEGNRSLDDRIDAAEAFYAARSAVPRFQITSAARPDGLDDRLAARGYLIDAPVVVETVTLDRFHIAGQPPRIMTSVAAKPSDDWLSIAVDRGRFSGQRGAFCGLLDRLGPRAGFALAKSKGVPVAIGLGVMDGQWLGIFNMSTLPESRRRRAGTAVLGALAAWGSARGALAAYLQVEKDNVSARGLYEGSGFAEKYAYFYRVKPTA